MTDHPITPPPELVQQWFAEQRGLSEASRQQIATRAAQWGADQELEACCEWVAVESIAAATELRAGRRPKPPSLKEQSLAALKRYEAEEWCEELTFDSSIIRRAIEALPE